MYNLEILEKGCEELGITLNDTQKNQFIQFYEYLVEKNKVMNLTGITEFDEVLVKHFLDSLCCVKAVDMSKVKTVMDIGTGAGFPGVPLKIAFPEVEACLLDSLNKRVKFLEEPEAAKKCIGYLPEMPPLYFDMTVLEYMKFAADLKKIPRNQKDKQIKEVMDMVKITDMKDRLIKNLSKGYRQRVGLAQAILGYPEVIILDEPTVGLDPKQIIEIRDLIKSLKQKHTVILSSHILSEVRAVCDYVLIISHGKLVASDTPDNLERLAAGSNSLLMKIKGEKDTIRKGLETIEGVTGVEMSYDSDEELWKTKLSVQENVDIREKVFYAMAKANCPIYEMQVKRVSLEDVFLELTEGEKKKSTGNPEKSQWKPVEDKSEEPEKTSDEKEGDQS